MKAGIQEVNATLAEKDAELTMALKLLDEREK